MHQSIMSVIKPGDAGCCLFKRGFLLGFCLFTLFSQTPAASNLISLSASQQSIDVPFLEMGKPIERELAGGEAHAYQLPLTAGQYAEVIVDQRRINIALSVVDVVGKQLIEVDGFSMGEVELAGFIAGSSSIYRLEVRSTDKAAPKGRYE